MGEDIDMALAAARRCEAGARSIGSGRMQAMAICGQGLAYGIQGDGRAAEHAVRRAEAVLPGDPEVLLAGASQVRIVTALFRDDIDRALRHNADADDYAAQVLAAPRSAQGFYSPAQIPL